MTSPTRFGYLQKQVVTTTLLRLIDLQLNNGIETVFQRQLRGRPDGVFQIAEEAAPLLGQNVRWMVVLLRHTQTLDRQAQRKHGAGATARFCVIRANKVPENLVRGLLKRWRCGVTLSADSFEKRLCGTQTLRVLELESRL